MPTNNESAYLPAPNHPPSASPTPPMPSPTPSSLIIKNHAVGIKPIDWKIQQTGMFVKHYPVVLGQNVAGTVRAVGSEVRRGSEVGDRVVGHRWGTLTGKGQDGAFGLFCSVPDRNATVLPEGVTFVEGAELPLAILTAICGTFREEYLGLPWPSLTATAAGSTIVVYGGSSSHNHDFCRSCGATDVFDHHADSLVDDVVKAVGSDTFAGIYDAISVPSCYAHDLAIFKKLGGGSLATVNPPPEVLRSDVRAKQMFGLGEWTSPVWESFVTPALERGMLKCVPEPLVVGKGLESVQAGFDRSRAGVSARKVAVEP